ncbi:hypothetical protein ACFQ0M_40505 [Kitasatospora aburaviensis]
MIHKVGTAERKPSGQVLEALARVLHTTPEYLLGGPVRTDSGVHHAIPGLQRVIAAYDLPEDGQVRTLPKLAAAVDLAVEDRLQSRYTRLAEQTPALLAELFRAVDQARGREHEQAAYLLALALRSADSVAYKYGYRDLSARLVELMRWAASLASDPALTAAAAYVRMETFFAADQLGPGLRSLRAAIDQLPAPSSEPLAAAGAALHMRAAVTAGRLRLPNEARAHLREAELLAHRVRERVYDGTAVGPDSLRSIGCRSRWNWAIPRTCGRRSTLLIGGRHRTRCQPSVEVTTTSTWAEPRYNWAGHTMQPKRCWSPARSPLSMFENTGRCGRSWPRWSG